MKKSRFLLLFLFLLFVPAWHQNCSAANTGEVRAMWVTRFEMDSREKIDDFLDTAQKFGINTLFVQVLGRGQAYYASRILPTVGVEKDYNPLAYALQKGQGKGLKIHAWLNMFYVWSKEEPPQDDYHILNLRPEWKVKDADGNYITGNIFLNPANPGVQNYLLNIILEVVRDYPLDGIHLDYLRYPGAEYGTNRTGTITRFVKDISYQIKRLKPQILLSAAVYANLEDARVDKGQDWIRWLNMGLIDFAVPMLYRKDNKVFEREINGALKLMKNKYILAGIGVYLISREQFKTQLSLVNKYLKKTGYLHGFSLFSYDFMKENPGYEHSIPKN